MSRKKYFSMNEVPVGTKMVVKETGKEVILEAVYNFPTTFKLLTIKDYKRPILLIR
tara:strand:+ start:176 stop:343 length:168 start_codon:yes stop_codon:yes gene_type:complete